MAGRSVVRMVGPLAPYASGFYRELRSRGYTRLSAVWQLRLMAHLSRWLAGEGLGGAAFTPARAEEFCAARRREGYTALLTVRGLVPLREFLHGQGVLPEPPAAAGPASEEDRLLARYREHLVCERGLVAQVVARRLRVAAVFLAGHPGLVGAGPAVGADQVSAFCVRELPGRRGGAASELATALRSFLRFVHLEGLVDAPLAQAVPAVAGWKGAGLPRGVTPAALVGLLASCDRRTRVGRRDYAILLLLARLALRCGEVAGLELGDFDWRAGVVLVRGKGGQAEQLPLPADVGAAVAGYLRRSRRCSGSRAVFLRAVAPAAGLTPRGVGWVVYAACDRAGLPRIGAHRLRHTAATATLRAGAPLTEVGQLLRHAAVATTGIYAKADFAALRPLAPPWPGGAA